MESISVRINRLGIVTDAVLDISPLMIFSGESGLGKSYVAILCHYFFYVWTNKKRLNDFLKDKGINLSSSIPDHTTALIITKSDLEAWLATDCIDFMRYMLGFDNMTADIEVTLPVSMPDSIEFKFSRELVGVGNDAEIYNKLSALGTSYRFQALGIDDESPYSYLLRYAIIKIIFGDFKALSNAIVLPPSRGTYLLDKNIKPKNGMWINFVESMTDLEMAQEIPEKTSEKASQLLHDIINGDINNAGGQYTYTTEGFTMPVSAAAASVRELGPIQLMINKRDISRISVLIEEPEAHLHPIKQFDIADIIGAMSMTGTYMQITSHSDYFLRRINDLIRLSFIKSRTSDEEYRSICQELCFNPDITIDPSVLSSYFLSRREDGTVSLYKQHSDMGVPFDTFKEVNGKQIYNSSKLYDKTFDYV